MGSDSQNEFIYHRHFVVTLLFLDQQFHDWKIKLIYRLFLNCCDRYSFRLYYKYIFKYI